LSGHRDILLPGLMPVAVMLSLAVRSGIFDRVDPDTLKQIHKAGWFIAIPLLSYQGLLQPKRLSRGAPIARM
jgi:hypothetical protein